MKYKTRFKAITSYLNRVLFDITVRFYYFFSAYIIYPSKNYAHTHTRIYSLLYSKYLLHEVDFHKIFAESKTEMMRFHYYVKFIFFVEQQCYAICQEVIKNTVSRRAFIIIENICI